MSNLMVSHRPDSWCSVRKTICRIFSAGLLAALLIAGPEAKAWNSTDMTGVLPSLDFTMTRARDGKTVTSADFKGKVVLLYFGYTSCPDVCPTTLLDIGTMLKTLGKNVDDVRVLFVTVDPSRDTLPVLKSYVAAFAPQVVGLRGSPDQLATLAKRYRVAYSVQPASNGNPVEVTHGSAVYVFDRNGAMRLLFTGLAVPNAKLTGMTADLRHLVLHSSQFSLWQWIENTI
jgi:protein SCO1/2